MIYLASPYSHPDPAVRHERAMAARHCTIWHLARHYPVLSMIAYGHELVRAGVEGDVVLPTDAGAWGMIGFPILRASSACWVLVLEHWERSTGVRAEIDAAYACGIPVLMLRAHETGYTAPQIMTLAQWDEVGM